MFNKEWSTKKIVLVSLVPIYLFVPLLGIFITGYLPGFLETVVTVLLITSLSILYFLSMPFLGIYEKLNLIDYGGFFMPAIPSLKAFFITALFYSLLLFIILTFISRRVKK